jgi:hypothetical protein
MSRAKKTATLHSKNDSRRAPGEMCADNAESAERRAAVRRALAGRNVNPGTARIIEDTAVIYARALKHLADR